MGLPVIDTIEFGFHIQRVYQTHPLHPSIVYELLLQRNRAVFVTV